MSQQIQEGRGTEKDKHENSKQMFNSSSAELKEFIDENSSNPQNVRKLEPLNIPLHDHPRPFESTVLTSRMNIPGQHPSPTSSPQHHHHLRQQQQAHRDVIAIQRSEIQPLINLALLQDVEDLSILPPPPPPPPTSIPIPMGSSPNPGERKYSGMISDRNRNVSSASSRIIPSVQAILAVASVEQGIPVITTTTVATAVSATPTLTPQPTFAARSWPERGSYSISASNTQTIQNSENSAFTPFRTRHHSQS